MRPSGVRERAKREDLDTLWARVAVGLTQDQGLALVVGYLVAFALPAFLFFRRLSREGEPHRWAWTFLVLLLSVFGMYEYRKHKKIEAKRSQSGPR